MTTRRTTDRRKRCQCGRLALPRIGRCVECFGAAQLQRGRAQGELATFERLAAAGRLRGEYETPARPAAVPGGISIDAKRWRQLAALTHPDRHGNSRASTEIFQWLNTIRAQVLP